MFVTFNQLEAGLWCGIGLIFALAGVRASGRMKRRCYLLALVFLAFGASDIVEAETGTWWPPWWLLAWKAACLVVMGWQWWSYVAARRLTEREYGTAIKFYLLGGIIQAASMSLLELPVVAYWFAKLCWRLGLWPTFPFPYDATDLGVLPGVLIQNPLAVVAPFAASVIGLSLVIAVAHSLMFFLVVLVHKQFGSPNYWPDIRTKIKLRAARAESARRAWWAWPAVQGLWLVWLQLHWGFEYAIYPIVNVSYPFLLANLTVVALLFITVNTTVLRSHVVAAVGPEEIRCVSCGYLLRGLLSDRCPECGHHTSVPGVVDYRLGWERLRTWRPFWKALRVIMLLGFASGPLLVPALLLRCPRHWLRFVPPVIHPSWQTMTPNPNAFPIRLDAVCVIRCDGALAVLLFEKKGPSHAGYSVGYWDGARGLGTRVPDLIESGTVTNGGGPILAVGPWQFTYGMASENMLWLTRPATTCNVTATAKDDFDGDLTWVPRDEEADNRP